MKKREQQIALSKDWNKSVIKQLKMSYGSIDYVEHTQVTQRLIALIPNIQMILGHHIYDTVEDDNGVQRKFLTGVEYTIKGTIDDHERSVTEIGMCDKPFFNEGNKKVANNGERAKECISDAVKRCAMRLGVGIELYDTSAWLNSYLNGIDTKKEKPIAKDDLKDQKEKLDDLISEVTSNS
mgnify:CR=1 FL=1|tara:strand:+ start:1662 stop:2204 length:543 start_codon:yes stop_codon:yes gene_type:complete